MKFKLAEKLDDWQLPYYYLYKKNGNAVEVLNGAKIKVGNINTNESHSSDMTQLFQIILEMTRVEISNYNTVSKFQPHFTSIDEYPKSGTNKLIDLKDSVQAYRELYTDLNRVNQAHQIMGKTFEDDFGIAVVYKEGDYKLFDTLEALENYITPCKRSAGFIKKSRKIDEDVDPNIYYTLCYNPGWAAKNYDIIVAMRLTASKHTSAGIITNTIKECDSYSDFMEVGKEIDNTGTFGPRDPKITLGVGHSFTQLGPNNGLNTPLMFADKSFIIDIIRVFAKAFEVAYSKTSAKNKLSAYYMGVWDASLNQFVDTYNFTDADLGITSTPPTKLSEPVTYARSRGFIKKGSSRENS